jgi:CDP-diacylglycerol--serine O-phosphatidyltransferase
MSDEEDSPARPRGVYWLPNLLTTGALFAGFYAIVAAIDLRFEYAGIAVFVAMVFDGSDGRVARWTKTESVFGKEYDSLSDMVSFGVAPAIVTYQWGVARIAEYGPLWRRVGWLVCFFYAAAAGLRLARFNSRAATQGKNYFEGLPSPSAAAIVAALIWLVTAIAGGLMISRFAFYSFKSVSASARVRFTYIVLIVVAIVCIALHPAAMLLTLFGCYALSAPLLWLYRKLLRKRTRSVPQT